MAITKTFNPAVPADSDDPREGAQNIRDVKQAVLERASEGGGLYWPTAVDADAGKPACGIQQTNKYTIYETDLATPVMDIDDNTKDVVFGDGATAANIYDIQGARYHMMFVSLPTATTGYIDGLLFYNSGPGAIEIRSAQFSVTGAPSGGTASSTIYKQAAIGVGTDPHGVSPTDILVNPPVIADGNFSSPVVSADVDFNDRLIDVGDMIIFYNIAWNGANGGCFNIGIRRYE